MRRCLFVALTVVVATFAFGGVARAATDPLDRYAATLRAFDPALDLGVAKRLARRTLAESNAYGLDARLVVALIATESNWHVAARSSAGATGLGQLMPQTAAGLGVDPTDPEANVHGTVRYLRSLLDRYARYAPQARFERSIAAYNAGAGAIDRYNGIPPYLETQTYVRRVIALWRRLAGV